MHVGYVMSRFPKVTETFILFEMVAVEAAGAKVELFPLLRERTSVMHDEARAYVDRARYRPFLSRRIIATNLRFLRRDARTYLSMWWEVLSGTWGSANFFFGALGVVPKSVDAAASFVEVGVEHVHCHFATHPAVAGLVIHRLTGIPFSFTAHGSDLHVDRHMLPQKVAASAFVVTVSEFNRRVILEEVGEELAAKVDVIHCGVDTDVFAPPTEPPPASECFSVVCVGTLHAVKGQRHLVEAAAKVVATGIDMRCTFVGSGPDEAELRELAETLGVADRITFLGSVSRPVVADTVRAASVVCAPSVPTSAGKREGIPVVLMEAMAAARPVVASRLSGIPELVLDGECGLLVEPGDSDEIAAALHRLHDDPQLATRLGEAARRHVLAEFDVNVNARELLDRIRAVSGA
jgi:colanic acid/amylovoran biosynthesis glycosyltransferase